MSVSSTNPSSLFGGTWVEWGSGKVPVGIDASDSDFNVVEKTGGEKTHTLTISEMPKHRHGGMFMSYLAGSRNQIGNDNNARYIDNTDWVGGDGSHNNLQPYITCYMWKRTA